MSTAKFLLEHFYYGQLVHGNKPEGSPRLLASSAGVTPDLAAMAVERVMLPPLIRADNSAWALVRGRQRTIPFLLVQAQQGVGNQLMLHYVIMPGDVMRAMGGNLRALSALVEQTMPVYDRLGETLPLLELYQAKPLSIDEQVNDILELMTVTRDRIDVIETMLSAIVQGVQLVIQGAPADLWQRLAFVQGLLALLPPSARFGVTFTTHSLPTTSIDTQIRFYSDDMPPADTAVFNWPHARITGVERDDDYSHFVVSQLRLDTELVIRRNMEMTMVAGWRLNQGDKLADALSYAAQRVRLDEALRNNQPVNKDEVGRILAEDPTMSDALRVLYAGHLMALSLAMEDMQHADPVARLLHVDAALEKATLRQLDDALKEGKAWLIYGTLMQWLSSPEGPGGRAWVRLTHRAVLAYLSDLLETEDRAGMVTLISRLNTAGHVVELASVAPDVVAHTLAFAREHALLADEIFLLAAQHLPSRDFITLMNDRAFLEQLSPEIRRVWAAMNHGATASASETLVRVVKAYGPEWEPMLLLRFLELACEVGQTGLLETPVLAVLLDVARSPHGPVLRKRLLDVVSVVDSAAIDTLTQPGPRYLLQIRLALGNYEELVRQMLRQHARIYVGDDRQHDYLAMIDALFSETPIPPEEIVRALQAINAAGLKSIPFIVAASAALRAQPQAEGVDALIGAILNQLEGVRHHMDMLPPVALLGLLEHMANQRDSTGAMRVVSWIALVAAAQESGGTRIMAEMYRLMDWSDRTRRVALDALRVFVREAGDDAARQLTIDFGDALGDQVRRKLDVTYAFKYLLGGMDLLSYAEHVQRAVDFLYTTVTVYADSKQIPSLRAVLTGFNASGGGMTIEDRRRVAKDVLGVGRSIVQLARQYRAGRGRDEQRHIAQLLTAETHPRSTLDIMRVISGYITRGERFPLEIEAGSYPLEGWSAQRLTESVFAAQAIFEGMITALPVKKPVKLHVSEVREEIESLLESYMQDENRETIQTLAVNLQYMVELVVIIDDAGDAKALEESGLARRLATRKQRPASTLEFYRLMSYYYNGI